MSLRQMKGYIEFHEGECGMVGIAKALFARNELMYFPDDAAYQGKQFDHVSATSASSEM